MQNEIESLVVPTHPDRKSFPPSFWRARGKEAGLKGSDLNEFVGEALKRQNGAASGVLAIALQSGFVAVKVRQNELKSGAQSLDIKLVKEAPAKERKESAASIQKKIDALTAKLAELDVVEV